MPENAPTRYYFTPPKNRLLRWLADPGADTPPHLAKVLLGELFASPKAVIAGVINGVILNVTALSLHLGAIFACFIILDVIIVTARLGIVRRAIQASARGKPTPTGLYMVIAGAWCALQGAMAFAAMQTGFFALQLLSAASVMALVGPICARNYAAPRYAVLLVLLSNVPFMVGAAVSGDPWMMIILFQLPLFCAGVISTLKRFHSMAISTLVAQQESHDHARRDALTGLLNRFGLMETLEADFNGPTQQFTLFYLDLDGFKAINDNFGHQAGDKVLQAVAERLRSCVRSSDLVARLGGDEFVIVAPGMLPTDASVLADRVLGRVGGAPYAFPEIGNLRVGVSVGFACAPDDGIPGDDLHGKADAALYEAKGAGRGVYRRFQGWPDRPGRTSKPVRRSSPSDSPPFAGTAPA